MFTLKLAAAAAVASLVALVPASSAMAVSYEDPSIDVEVHPTTLIGGGSFSGTATPHGIDCDWTITFLDQVVEGQSNDGEGFDFTFDTPEVDEETEETLFVECVYDDGNMASAAPRAQTLSASSQPRTAPATRRHCRPL